MEQPARDKNAHLRNELEVQIKWGEWMCEMSKWVNECVSKWAKWVNDLYKQYQASSSKANQKQGTPSRKQWGQTSNYEKEAGENWSLKS